MADQAKTPAESDSNAPATDEQANAPAQGEGAGEGTEATPPETPVAPECAECATLSGKLKDLQSAVDEATGKLPAEGSLVIEPAQAEAVKALQALGKSAQEITDAFTRLSTLEGEIAAHTAESTARAAAATLQWDADLLAYTAQRESFRVEERVVDEKPVPYAVAEGEALPLEKFVERFPTALQKALKGNGKTAPGVEFPEQKKGGQAPPSGGGVRSALDRIYGAPVQAAKS